MLSCILFYTVILKFKQPWFLDSLAKPINFSAAWVPLWCSHILETPVTEREFVEQLHELNHKINFVKEQSFKDAKSCSDVKDILEKLKIKVVLCFWVDDWWIVSLMGRYDNLKGTEHYF